MASGEKTKFYFSPNCFKFKYNSANSTALVTIISDINIYMFFPYTLNIVIVLNAFN